MPHREYDVAHSVTIADLVETVDQQIALGWQVAGGVFYDGNLYLQALVR